MQEIHNSLQQINFIKLKKLCEIKWTNFLKDFVEGNVFMFYNIFLWYTIILSTTFAQKDPRP